MTRSMFSDDPILLVNAYLDGELDPANALAIEQRMAADPALAAKYTRIGALQRLLRERLPREAAPPGLRARIEASTGMNRPRAPCRRSNSPRRCHRESSPPARCPTTGPRHRAPSAAIRIDRPLSRGRARARGRSPSQTPSPVSRCQSSPPICIRSLASTYNGATNGAQPDTEMMPSR